MTMTINQQNVSKAVINHAITIAKEKETEVVIFGSMVGNVTRHLVVTIAEWEACDNTDELNLVTKIDSNGNFVD